LNLPLFLFLFVAIVLIIEKVIAIGKRTNCWSAEESRNNGITILPIIVFVCANLLLKMGRG